MRKTALWIIPLALCLVLAGCSPQAQEGSALEGVLLKLGSYTEGENDWALVRPEGGGGRGDALLPARGSHREGRPPGGGPERGGHLSIRESNLPGHDGKRLLCGSGGGRLCPRAEGGPPGGSRLFGQPPAAQLLRNRPPLASWGQFLYNS